MDLSLLDYLQKDNFVFYEIVPPLKEIASFNVALALCFDIVDRKTFKDEQFELDQMLRYNHEIIAGEAEQLLQQWNIPVTIKNSINEWCSTVAFELSNWLHYINRELFHTNFLHRSHLKCLVWQSNGRIHHEMTARKMLSHPDIDQLPKFVIMCDFCLTDEIEGLLPGFEFLQVLEKLFIHAPDTFYTFPLLYYWVCKLNNQLHLIPVDDEFDSMEFFMLSNYVCNFSSIEYFWNSVDERDQIILAIKFLDLNFMANEQISLFAKLNEFQKCSVIAEIPHAIIANFIQGSNFEAALFLWNRVENLSDDDQFSTLLTNIMKKLHKKRHLFLLAKLWDTAYDDHKHHFVYTRTDFIIEYFFSRTKTELRDDKLPFLSTILSYASSELRRNIILEHGDVLFIRYQNYPVVNKIIEFCLPDSDDIVLFEALLQGSQDIESYYSECYENGDFEIWAKFLESYAPYQSILKHHVRRAMDRAMDGAQKLRHCGIYFFENWPYVKKLLNIAYGADLSNVIKIKNKLIFSFDARIYENYEPSVEGLRDYKKAIQDVIDDRIRLAKESAVKLK